MWTSIVRETAIVVALFAGYVGLWRTKRARDTRRSGTDPEVLYRATTPMQAYFAKLVRFLTMVIVAVVGLHALAPCTWPPLVRAPALNSGFVDTAGALLGLAGLCLCALAQGTMGTSWRVGIDTSQSTALITQGIYHAIRNPTYLGLHLVNVGLWLVWPTTLVACYGVLFFIVMDIQVRAEEEHLGKCHGSIYLDYARRSWRYIPWIY